MQIDHHTPLCFVDLETTGMSPRYHRVIEIGIVRVEQGKVVREYKTLLNPGVPVPAFITSLTGISSAMLVDAPQFEDVALEVAEVLEGGLFVAHNAGFDYGFLGEEFKRLGLSFSYPYLCTAKLSRLLFPEVQGHSVDAIVGRYGLDAGSRHRAFDDALVLHQFINAAMRVRGETAVYEAMLELVRVRRLPQHVKEEMLTRLPERPGVYFFYGKGDELLYVGKSRRIRTRVRSHFAKDGLSGKGRDMLSQIRSIEHRETAGEFGALLLESHLIKERAPVYNVRERERRELCLARESQNEEGYATVTFECVDTIERGEERAILGIYKNRQQAKDDLALLADEHHLCPHLMGVESRAPCFAHQLERCGGACVGKEKSRHYNRRFRDVFAERRMNVWPYAGPVCIEEIASNGSGEVFIVDNWRLLAALHTDGSEWEEFMPGQFRFDYDVYKILSRELLRKRPKVTVRQLTGTEQAFLNDDTTRTLHIDV